MRGNAACGIRRAIVCSTSERWVPSPNRYEYVRSYVKIAIRSRLLCSTHAVFAHDKESEVKMRNAISWSRIRPLDDLSEYESVAAVHDALAPSYAVCSIMMRTSIPPHVPRRETTNRQQTLARLFSDDSVAYRLFFRILPWTTSSCSTPIFRQKKSKTAILRGGIPFFHLFIPSLFFDRSAF